MTQPSYRTSGNKLLPNGIDGNGNGLWVQPSLLSTGHGDLYNTSAADQVSLKSECKSSVRPTSSIEMAHTNGNRSIIRGGRNVLAKGTPCQNVCQLSMPTVVPRPVVHEKRLPQEIKKQIPQQCAFSTQMWASTPRMHSGKHQHYGSHTMVQQGQRIPQQYMVNQAPVSSSALIPSGVMVQSGIAKKLQYNTRMPISTTALQAQQNTIIQGDPTEAGGTGEKTSDMSSSYITDVNSLNGRYSTVMGTPMPSYMSPSGYINTPSNIDTPFLFCTPASSYTSAEINHCMPSGTAFMDTPPSLDLYNQNPKIVSYPAHVSCNIQLAPVSSIQISNPSKKLESARPNPKLTIQNTGWISTNSITSPLSKWNGCEENQNKRENHLEDDEDLWDASFDYFEWSKDGRSNLFITWEGQKSHLVAKLRQQNFEVSKCFSTRKAKVFNVVFQDHKNARMAFTTQREIHLRMLPPRKSTRKWFRSPSPAFLVKYETKFRLTIRSGKASSHDIVGEFLMTNFEEKKGCYVWADQLKGHRIRVVGARGYIQLPNGNVIYLNSPPTQGGKNKSMGWVSYRSKCTRQDFVTRRSGNTVREYIYKS